MPAPRVQLVDAYENPVKLNGVAIGVAIAAPVEGRTLAGTTTVPIDDRNRALLWSPSLQWKHGGLQSAGPRVSLTLLGCGLVRIIDRSLCLLERRTVAHQDFRQHCRSRRRRERCLGNPIC